jgi:transcriptional regulator with XRE-family HTH domain
LRGFFVLDRTEPTGIDSPVRAARERRGWSRETLAFHSGISWSAIAQVESGRRTHLRPATLSALAEALGVTIDYLVHGKPTKAPMLQHAAYPYDADARFASTIGSFLAGGIERAEGVLAVTTAGNIELLREQLGKDADMVEFVESPSVLTTPPAALERFRRFCDGKIDAGVPWVRLIAEPIWSGRSEAEVGLWTRFESLLNLLFGSSPMMLVCPYDERSVSPELMRQAHLTHPEILSETGMSESGPYIGPGHLALDLQEEFD